ncbi:MAG: HAMP domain-containing sensor histidine kinase, partial [Alphaproteobacteria bacterium]
MPASPTLVSNMPVSTTPVSTTGAPAIPACAPLANVDASDEGQSTVLRTAAWPGAAQSPAGRPATGPAASDSDDELSPANPDGLAGARSKLLRFRLEGMWGRVAVVLANPLGTGLVVALFQDSAPQNGLLIWLAAAVAAAAVRIAHLHSVAGRAFALRGAARRRAYRVAVAGATASGLVWGIGAAWLVMTVPGLTPVLLLAVILIGMTMGALASSIGALAPFMGYQLGALLPFAAGLMTCPSPCREIGFFALMYAAVLTYLGRNMARQARRAEEARIRIDRLARRLSRMRRDLVLERRERWRVLAHLSHELRTPLNAVNGFADLMAEETMGPLGMPVYKDYARSISRSSGQLVEMVDRLTQLAAAETSGLALTMHRTDIESLARETLGRFARAAVARGVTLRVHADSAMPAVASDATRLGEALAALLENAIDHSPPGGQVVVRLTQESDGRGVRGVCLAVVDTGSGMSAEDLERAILPFARLRDPSSAGASGIGIG